MFASNNIETKDGLSIFFLVADGESNGVRADGGETVRVPARHGRSNGAGTDADELATITDLIGSEESATDLTDWLFDGVLLLRPVKW